MITKTVLGKYINRNYVEYYEVLDSRESEHGNFCLWAKTIGNSINEFEMCYGDESYCLYMLEESIMCTDFIYEMKNKGD